jgi:predicted ester cyclase
MSLVTRIGERGEGMMLEQHKATVQRYVDDVMNGRSRTAVDEMISTSAVADHLKAGMDNIEALFSEVRYELDAMVEEGDTVALFCTLHGKHTGEVNIGAVTVAPTGRHIQMPYAVRFRMQDAKIASVTSVSDFLQVLTQMTAEVPTH